MPLYAMIGYDHPDSIARRETIRAEHRAYFRANIDRVRLAGAFNDENGRQIGTMIVFEADDEQTVWDWIRDEPFCSNGIYRQLEVRLWNLVVGEIVRPESAA